MTDTGHGTPYDQAVWTWARHLRAGGGLSWSEWVAAGPHVGEPPRGWSPPGAAQLELVRRAAALASASPEFESFADVVLSRSGPGRGLAQQPLTWARPGDRPRVFGAPPVDPADVPLDELVRVGVGALTELVLRHKTPSSPDRPVRRRRFSRSPAFALGGAPVTTSAVRRALEVGGHVEGGRSPEVVLFAEPLDHVLAQVWSSRVQRGAPVRWAGFLDRWSGRPDLPPAADLPAMAREWAGRVGVGRVHVVVATDVEAALATTTRLLGVPVPPASLFGSPRWKDLSPEAVDVLRRVNNVLTVRVSEDRLLAAVRDASVVLENGEEHGHCLTVPEELQDWTRQRAARIVEDLRAAGYPVHGQLDDVVPTFEGLPTRPDRDGVLGVLLAGCLNELTLRHVFKGVAPQ